MSGGRLGRRGSARAALLGTASALVLLATACGDSSLGGDDGGGDKGGTIKIGLLVPQSGVYNALGNDMKAGFEVYLEQHGNKLGGKTVQVVLADEGETADSGKAAADKLVKQDKVAAVVGVVNSAVMNGVKDLFESSKIPLIGSNASPTTLTGMEYIWRTSYVNDEPGVALGKYVAEKAGGPVYLVAAGYQAGEDEINGFLKTFEPAGGKVSASRCTRRSPRPRTSSRSWPTCRSPTPRRCSPSTPAVRRSTSSSSTSSSASPASCRSTPPASSPRAAC
jgi:branched-chain amino acid transport system substrate-binding protein